MATGYKISLGYCSGHSGDNEWESLKRIVDEITRDEIEVEYLSEPNPWEECLRKFIELYFTRVDATIRIVDPDEA